MPLYLERPDRRECLHLHSTRYYLPWLGVDRTRTPPGGKDGGRPTLKRYIAGLGAAGGTPLWYIDPLSLSDRSTGDAKATSSTNMAMAPTHRYLWDFQVIQSATYHTVDFSRCSCQIAAPSSQEVSTHSAVRSPSHQAVVSS